MLTVNNIQKTYEGKPLLKKVSFEVNQDETVCLLGTSGSGKSTLLRIIAGLEESEDGNVYWNGEDLSAYPAHQREFGLMFQDYALFPHRNVAENIAFGLRMQNVQKEQIEKKVEQALQTIEMTGFADRKVTELSGGEQQRVALARAIAPQPRLLMLDEPLGALDRTLREQLSRELRRILRHTKIPAIYVTHDQEEAFSIADRLLLLHDGVIIQSGKPADFYYHPKNVWVAKFFGLGNFVKGEVLSRSPLTVRTSLGIFHASCNQNAPPEGKRATLLFRPNQAYKAVGEEMNSITGKVVDQIFQGETYRLSIRISDDIPIFFVSLSEPVKMGETITLGYHTENILCLQDEEGKS